LLILCQNPVIHLHSKWDIFPHFSAHFYTMNNRGMIAKLKYVLGVVVFSLVVNSFSYAADGKTLFSQNCASCHNLWKDGTGPALTGVEGRWEGNRSNLYIWINKWQSAVAAGIPQAVKIQTYAASAMNNFNFKQEDMDAILDYIRDAKPPPPTPPDGDPTKQGSIEKDSSLLYGILTLVLGIIALTLLYVNSNLRKVADEKEGIPSAEPIPFYRNKSYLLLAALVAFVVGGYLTAKGATALGRSKDYQPEQPIYYSHKVHAGLNQINCLYCHTGAQEGKQATIPSVNICMNCHMSIQEYAGPDMYTEDGKKVNGTAEIKKLYEYAGYSGKPGEIWDPATAKATGIPWIKIHNLPDHVYFNHSQHVKVGEVACQKCHGEIQEMGEVKQHSDLSMGWCINCHRETGVQFSSKDSTGKVSGNGFYEQYSKLHEDVKNGKEKVTVENIGGTECQKCHY
jgi:mono/diheme cytochrome c family protein